MLDVGTYGAKVQSWRDANPRELLKKLIDENPNGDPAYLLPLFRDLVERADKDYLGAIIEYWFTNNFNSLMPKPAPARHAIATAKAERTTQAQAIKQKVEQHIETKARVLLLELTMPNGKVLRDCTGAEVRQLGYQMTPWLSRIANRVKPGELVGSVLSEAEARTLFDQ